MSNPDPGKNKEAGIVSQKPNVPAPRLRRPADEPVAATEVAWRGAPRQAGQRAAPGLNHVLQMFPDRLRVTKVVVLLDQAVVNSLLCRAPNLLELFVAVSALSGIGDQSG